MKKKLLAFLILTAWLAVSCSPSADATIITGQTSNGQLAAPGQSQANRFRWEPGGNFAAAFQMQFNGPTPWKYLLTIRQSDKLRETSLHVEGISGANNPGDVRLVTDGTTSWMIGPGTDQECVQFPNNQGMDPKWVTPDTLLSGQQIESLLQSPKEESISGKPYLRYSSNGVAVGSWKNARVELWKEKTGNTLVTLAMQAAGEDPFFGTGSGTINAKYEVGDLGSGAIEPVKGCEISVPLPPTAKLFVRLPGMASFESTAAMDEMRSFYQGQLPPAGWTEKDPPAQSDGTMILSYQRGAEQVEIHIQAGDSSGSKVKLLFLQAK